MGRENTTKQVHKRGKSPPSRKARPRALETTEGGTGGDLGGGSGGGRAPRRGPADRVHGWGRQGRSQGRDRRSQGRPDGARRGLEQAELGGTQATAVKATHGGADRGRSHGGGRADDSRGPTDGSGAGGGGARGGDREPMSQGDKEDPEDHGGTDGSGTRCGGVDPEGGAEGKEESGLRGWRRRQGIL